MIISDEQMLKAKHGYASHAHFNDIDKIYAYHTDNGIFTEIFFPQCG